LPKFENDIKFAGDPTILSRIESLKDLIFVSHLIIYVRRTIFRTKWKDNR
jgi:hypothetical protein